MPTPTSPITMTPYTVDKAVEWDSLVNRSASPSLLMLRGYMDYHQDRFEDCSLMFYKHDRLCGVLPAEWRDGVVTSHGGLTYGGLLWDKSCKTPAICEMLSTAIDHYRSLGTRLFRYRPMPYIYNLYPAGQDLYWLFAQGAQLVSRNLSSAIDLQSPLPYSTLRQRHLGKSQTAGLTVSFDQSEESWQAYWHILQEVLMSRHQVSPVHSLNEILLLHSRFPQDIRLATVCDSNGNIIAGTVLYLTAQVCHLQYIASSPTGRDNGALELLVHILMQDSDVLQRRYLDFGISTEQGGRILNDGLLFQKEGLGGRGVCYDHYELTI